MTPTALNFPRVGSQRDSMTRVLAACLMLLLWTPPCFGFPPPERMAVLRRGINITGWFRYPASRDPAALRSWLSDTAIIGLKGAGFTFVRLAVDPAILDAPTRLVFLDQVRRLQSHGLAVVVSPHPVSWHLDTSPADRERFVQFWHDLAPILRPLPPALTFPEVLNEPAFHADPSGWDGLQHNLLTTIRAALPGDTIILTGSDWGSIAGLLAVTPAEDGNVVYSFHFYDPAELTSLAAYRPGLDREALELLPFPETDAAECRGVARNTSDPATRDLILFWCATGWDANRVRTRIQDAAIWATKHGVALLAGEFGASAAINPTARLAWLRLVRETCEENAIGWTLWGYDDVMGFNLPRPPVNKPVLDRAVLRALGLSVL
jgi:endoglucanase